jgi:hypothetical protein
MSLLASASLWTNNDTEISLNKKRIPSMNRKTVKKTPSMSNQSLHISARDNPEEIEGSEEPVAQEPVQRTMQQYNSVSSVDSVEHAITSDMAAMNQRNEKVSQLINKLTSDNAGTKLSDFQPLSHPMIQKRTDLVQGRGADQQILPPQNNPLQIPAVLFQSNNNMNHKNSTKMGFAGLNQTPDLGENGGNVSYSNYKNVYDPSKVQPIVQNTIRNGVSSSSVVDAKLLDKLNYMVYLLEQQHNERTSNITEEFVLYTFLGVFIIFIVDAFSRSGRYVR